MQLILSKFSSNKRGLVWHVIMQEGAISILVVVRDGAKFLLLSNPPRTWPAHMAANDELGVCCRAREWGHSESEITNTKEGDFLARKKEVELS